MATVRHCNLRPLDNAPVVLDFNYEVDNHCHPFFHRATTLENGRILDKFQTTVLI